jgi:hypothetical protein
MFSVMTYIIVPAFVVIALLGFVATRPSTFRYVRSATIKAKPEVIYGLPIDFREWAQWSPWEKLDPGMQRTHSGAPSGKGAAYAWEGNKKVGAGRMEIAEVASPTRVVIKLDFVRPFEAHNTTEFVLTPAAGATQVTWAMTGDNTFMGKLMGVFVNMDKLIGKDFETGLANLTAVAEK